MPDSFKYLLVVLFEFCFLRNEAQIANYVSNGGFELCGNCVNSTSLFKRPKDWNAIDSNQFFGELLSKVLSPYLVPLSSYTYQWPRHGNNFLGTTPYCSTCSFNTRGYPRNTLKAKLEAGKTYCFSMYVNLMNKSSYAISSIGAYFADSSTDTITHCTIPLTYLTPQIQNPTGNFLTDTLNWILIRGLYTANGTEKYVILGNFNNDANTDTLRVNLTYLPQSFSSYCIDDVSCIDIDLPAFAGRDTSVIPGDSIYIGRESDVGIDEACMWYTLPTLITPTTAAIDTIAGFWIKPAETCTYVVKQDICGNVKWDTVVVYMNPVGNIEWGMLNDELVLFPNPAQDFVELKAQNMPLLKEFNLISIYNNLGQLIREEEAEFKDKAFILKTNGLENGIYFLNLKSNNNGTVSKRVVIAR